MKEKIQDIVSRYVKTGIAFLILPIIIRGAELIYLNLSFELTASMVWFEFIGLGLDLLYLFALSMIWFPVYFLIAIRFPKTAFGLFFFLMLVVMLLWFSLVKYFVTTLIPLDQVLFAYTIEEIVKIVLSSTSFDLIGTITFFLLVALPLLFLWITRPWQPGKRFLILLGSTGMIALVALPFIMPSRVAFARDLNYFLVENKFHYALKNCSLYLWNAVFDPTLLRVKTSSRQATMPPEIKRAAIQYQQSNPQWRYYSPEYPFLREDDTPDALGEYLALQPEQPNIVFIIIESLTPSFIGENPWFGNFMPFLDSLRKKSLYWENCLSTSERTFNVLPAVLGSLPYAKAAFLQDVKSSSNHYSLIRYLKNAGYFGGFYYGGDPSFTHYDSFVTREGVEYILDFFDPKYEENVVFEEWFRWGYPDGDLFERALIVQDSLDQSPRLDIFLTLSMHAPFKPPNLEKYLCRVDQRMNELKVTPSQRASISKLKQVFATILYTDEMLRRYFEAMKKKPEFARTLFIITGDHAMPELHTSTTTPIMKFKVPLIIYSPMLIKPARFSSVVSHLDITPSLLALLKSHDMVTTRQYCHWLGKGLVVKDEKDRPVEVSFAANNTEESEFLKNGILLSYEKQYFCDSALGLSLLDRDREQASLQALHDNYLALTRYAVEYNAFVPDYLFFDGNYHAIPIEPQSQRVFNDQTTSGEFISVMDHVPFGWDYNFMDLKLGVNIRFNSSDSQHLPVLILEINDRQHANYLYTPLTLQLDTIFNDSTGSWRRYKLNQRIDMDFIPKNRDKLVKMYFWNPNRITVTMDSLTFQLTGYLKPDSYRFLPKSIEQCLHEK